MTHKDYGADVSFIDLLFNLLLFFVLLVFIQPEAAKKNDNNTKVKCEFLVTATWSNDSPNDVDLYLQEPSQNIIYFSNRDTGLSNLDRDDLGYLNDTVKLPSGEDIVLHQNKEVITIRGTMPGEYVVNSHMFANRNMEPTSVTVTVEKMNPYGVVFTKTFELLNNGDEVTVCRFTVDKESQVTDINYLDKSLVKLKGM